MQKPSEPETAIVRALRAMVVLERALLRIGLTLRRGRAAVDEFGEPVIEVGVLAASDCERLAETLDATASGAGEVHGASNFHRCSGGRHTDCGGTS